jgi:signal transduction histidine kinase
VKLRTKVAMILLAFFTLFGVVDFALQRLIILPSFVELETEEARKDMSRAIRLVTVELNHLANSVINEAEWDESYQFVLDGNQRHIESNLGGEELALTGYHVNLIHFYDNAGALVWGATGDSTTGKPVDIPELTGRDLSPDHVLLDHDGVGSDIRGIYMSRIGPLLISSRPILTSEVEGPARGTLVMARYLDEAAILALANRAQINLLMTAIEIANETPRERGILARIDPNDPYPIEHSEEVAKVYSAIESLNREHVFLFTVLVPRDISARGRGAVAIASFSLACAGPLLVALLLFVLQRTVFTPTTELTRHAVAIAETDDLEARLAMNRQDEIGLLAREFDRMVERLAQARRNFVEQSFHAGVAEMASGVLHNIRNAITPAAVQVQVVEMALEDLPLEHLDLALEGLAAGDSSEGRRKELAVFGRLAAEEIRKSRDMGRAELEALERQLVHIQEILTDQERFSRAERVSERVELSALVAEGMAILSPSCPQNVEIEIDESIREVGFLEVARTAVVQVISNIALNGLEAVGRAKRSDGRLRISAFRDASGCKEMIHLRFEDNGVGVAPDQLQQIFERGFSTKESRQGTGLGLHWCANTVRSFGGAVHAESRGVGEGAVVYLTLPVTSVSRQAVSAEEAA